MKKFLIIRNGKIQGRVLSHSPDQAIGFWVSKVLKQPWNFHKFQAKRVSGKPITGQREIVLPCGCGYQDPQLKRASRCPNCNREIERTFFLV